MSASEFEQVIEAQHAALAVFVTGDPAPLKALFSNRDDVSVANPFGPAVRGWAQVAETVTRAATFYRDGEATGFDLVTKYVTAEVAYAVEVERYRAKVGGADEFATVELRVTSIFRVEDGVWKISHRHADPITSARPPTSVVEQ
jgi:ketosteroid isomerase-like protein